MNLEAPDYRRLINELQSVITDTLKLLDDFEDTGMNEHMVEDYERLHGILNTAITDQRRYQAELLAVLRKDANATGGASSGHGSGASDKP